VALKGSKAGRLKPILMLFLVFGPALLLIFVSLNKCEHKFEQLPVYGKLENFKFVSASGDEITPETQLGKVTLYSTIQAGCPQNCAIDLLKYNMMVYQHYRKYQKKMGHIKFVSIVTDQDGNPVDDLTEVEFLMNDIVQGYDPSIWTLVTGDPKQIYDIENNGVNLVTMKSDTAFATKPYLEMLLIVDKENNLRLVRKGNQEGLIRDFKEHIALLQKQYDKAAYKARKEAE
jgi:cytochrome oxidase Cu insertion factor (SCO1/SenC/PrrC family)